MKKHEKMRPLIDASQAKVDSDDGEVEIIEDICTRPKKTSQEIKKEQVAANGKSLADRMEDVTLFSQGSISQEVIIVSDDDDDRILYIDEDNEVDGEIVTRAKEERLEDINANQEVEIRLSSDSTRYSPESPPREQLSDVAAPSISKLDKEEEMITEPTIEKKPMEAEISAKTRRITATKAARKQPMLTSGPIKCPAKTIAKQSKKKKDRHELDAEKRKHIEAQAKLNSACVRKVADRMASLSYKAGGTHTFHDIQSTFESLLIINCHFKKPYCEHLLQLNDRDFLQGMEETAPECNISKMDERSRSKAVEVFTRFDNNLPRIPRRSREVAKNIGARPFSFAKWTNDNGELTMRYEKTIADGRVIAPLGVVFDGDRFFFSGRDKIFSCDEEGNHLNIRLDGLNNPSALCVINPGNSFGYLEHDKISIFYKHGNDKKIVADNQQIEGARGLAYVSCGALVTAQRKDNSTILKCFDIEGRNKVKATYRYGMGSPSFMSSYDDTIFITDLDNQTIRSFKIEKIENSFTISPVNEARLNTLPFALRCTYPSGIICDSRRELLVVDARPDGAGKVLWGDSFLQNWKKVVVQNGTFPYTSQIAASPSGTLFAACRSSHRIMMFRIK